MDYLLKGIKTFTGNEGIGLNASIYLGKRKIADVLDDANGGDVQIRYLAREDEAPFVAMVEAWFAASGEEKRWNEEMQKLCANSDVTPEPARLISKIDQWINAKLADWEREKNLKRWAKTKTPFRLIGDPAEEWRMVNAPVSPKVIQFLRTKYGSQIEGFRRIKRGVPCSPVDCCFLKNEQAAMLNTKGMRFPVDVILICIRWYAAYPLSYRHLEEIMQERGVVVDHSSIKRWAIRFLPVLEKAFRKHKHAVGTSWRMDETYIKVNGAWKYLYRAVDKQGQTVDFLLTAKRDAAAARRFFEKALSQNTVPDKVAMDKSGANQAALEQLNKERKVPITIRQVKYLNNIVEQDHRAVKRITRPMLGFKSFRAARAILAGIELMHMIRKGQFMLKGDGTSFADQFYALAGHLRLV